jgi:hypothetical protein
VAPEQIQVPQVNQDLLVPMVLEAIWAQVVMVLTQDNQDPQVNQETLELQDLQEILEQQEIQVQMAAEQHQEQQVALVA